VEKLYLCKKNASNKKKGLVMMKMFEAKLILREFLYEVLL